MSDHRFQLGIVSLFYNEAPYLKEWLEYHALAGVEYFRLYDHKSDDNWEEILSPYIKRGLVDVFPAFEGGYANAQSMAYKDAISSCHDIKWMACIDSDEFILPLGERAGAFINEKWKRNPYDFSPPSIAEVLNEGFNEAKGVAVPWTCFGHGDVVVPPYEPFLPHLTKSMLPLCPDGGVIKSIIRPELADTTYHHTSHAVGGEGYPNPFCPSCGSNLLRINHYWARDKNFFNKVRLKCMSWGQAARENMSSQTLTDQQQQQQLDRNAGYSKREDLKIIEYIKNRLINAKGEIPPSIWKF